MAEKDYGKLLVIGLIAALLYFAYQSGAFAPKPTAEKTVEQKPIVIEKQVAPTVQAGLPIESLKVSVKNKYTMDEIQDVQVEFWEVGADVSDPNQRPLDEVTTNSEGIGTTTSMIIQTGKSYDVWFNGSSTYYDEKVENYVINYNPQTGKGYLLVDEKSYYPAVPVGSFADLSSISEASSCVNTSYATDTIAYDLSACDGTFYIRLDLGNSKANSELHDVVMCFRDSDGDMEGDEITGITATYVSGSTRVVVPGNLLGYWKDGMGAAGKRCFKIADSLGPGEKARWELSFTVNEGNFASGEEFEITVDDLGDYGAKQYPSGSAKASPDNLIITVQA